MSTRNIDTSSWQEVTWLDVYPGPGAYMGDRKEYQVHGRTVRANNWLHATYVWALNVCTEAGYDGVDKCAHCGQRIRYVTICRDADGAYHPVGEQCADFIAARCDRADWAERKLVSRIKKAKDGQYYMGGKLVDVAPWYWNLPREQRPAGVRTSKYQAPGAREAQWWVMIWGNDAGDVLAKYEELRNLKPIAEAAAQAEIEEIARRAAESISWNEQQRIQAAGRRIGLKASTKKTEHGYQPVLKDAKGKIVWIGDGYHVNRDNDGRNTAALPVALRELRRRASEAKSTPETSPALAA